MAAVLEGSSVRPGLTLTLHPNRTLNPNPGGWQDEGVEEAVAKLESGPCLVCHARPAGAAAAPTGVAVAARKSAHGEIAAMATGPERRSLRQRLP